jgi:hypothetical protein
VSMSSGGVISTVVAVSLAVAGLRSAPQDVQVVRFGTKAMLATVVRSSVPACPTGSRTKGVIVARVQTRTDGTVESATIEPSWDHALDNSLEAKAVQRSLNDWSFKPETLRGVPVLVRSRIFFYVDCQAAHASITVQGLTDLHKEAR